MFDQGNNCATCDEAVKYELFSKGERIKALESDAEVDAQLLRDKDKRIAELEAQVKETHAAHIANIGQAIIGGMAFAAPPSSPAVRCSAGKHTCECGFHIDHCVAPAGQWYAEGVPCALCGEDKVCKCCDGCACDHGEGGRVPEKMPAGKPETPGCDLCGKSLEDVSYKNVNGVRFCSIECRRGDIPVKAAPASDSAAIIRAERDATEAPGGSKGDE
jgi:hypothetical protein